MNLQRGEHKEYNGMCFSLAWFDYNSDSWKTYFRKFDLSIKHRRLTGEYSHNLYFDEQISLKDNDCKFMLYAIPKEITFETIFNNFEKNNLDFILFKDIFILDKKQLAIYSPNLKYFKESFIRLRGGGKEKLPTNNQLQIKIYKPKESNHEFRNHIFPEKKCIGITTPIFQIPLENLLI